MKELSDLLKHNEFKHEYQMHGEDHRDAWKRIDKENEFFSVILIQEPLDESMMENPKYVKKIPVTHTSRIEQEARSLMDFDYHGNFNWINEEVKKHYPEVEDKEFYKEFDYYIKCLLDSYFPKALENCLWEWAFFRWTEIQTRSLRKSNTSKSLINIERILKAIKKASFCRNICMNMSRFMRIIFHILCVSLQEEV